MGIQLSVQCTQYIYPNLRSLVLLRALDARIQETPVAVCGAYLGKTIQNSLQDDAVPTAG